MRPQARGSPIQAIRQQDDGRAGHTTGCCFRLNPTFSQRDVCFPVDRVAAFLTKLLRLSSTGHAGGEGLAAAFRWSGSARTTTPVWGVSGGGLGSGPVERAGQTVCSPKEGATCLLSCCSTPPVAAPARAFTRLDHERLPARDRRRGDHRHDPRATRADDARQRRPRTLGPAGQRVGAQHRATARRPRLQQLLWIGAARPSSLMWLELLKTISHDRSSRSFRNALLSSSACVDDPKRLHIIRGGRPSWTSRRSQRH